MMKSKGCKPVTTGRFKSRKVLINAVCRHLGQPPITKAHGNRTQRLTTEEIGEECGICQSLVSKIKKEFYDR